MNCKLDLFLLIDTWLSQKIIIIMLSCNEMIVSMMMMMMMMMMKTLFQWWRINNKGVTNRIPMVFVQIWTMINCINFFPMQLLATFFTRICSNLSSPLPIAWSASKILPFVLQSWTHLTILINFLVFGSVIRFSFPEITEEIFQWPPSRNSCRLFLKPRMKSKRRVPWFVQTMVSIFYISNIITCTVSTWIIDYNTCIFFIVMDHLNTFTMLNHSVGNVKEKL